MRGPGRRRMQHMGLAGRYAIMAMLSVVFSAPFVWMVSTALKADAQIFRPTPEWIPRPALWSNFPDALSSFPFLLYLRNTLIICISCVIGALISCTLPAYGFSRIRWRGRDSLFLIMIATIMLPSQVTMLPVFVLFRTIGWIGTYKPLIVPSFFGSAFSIFLLRQFFMTIPQELSDAARIDGCSEMGIFCRVILPLSKPALATVALLVFMGHWMDFMGPLIYLNDERMYTLAVGLNTFLGRHGAEWNLLMAASTVVTLPMIVIFFLAQRTFIQGITLTGMKQ